MKQITKTERQEIYLLKRKGYSLREIALVLGRNVSSISREISRNSVKGKYDPEKAQHKSYARWKYRKTAFKKILHSDGLREYIHQKMKEGWSPEQIAGRWKRETQKKVSKNAVYRYVYSQYGVHLTQYLESKRKRPRKRRKKAQRSLIPNRIWIDDRPEEINEKLRIGDYEGDLIVSIRTDKTAILTLLERRSRLLLALLVPNKKPRIVGLAAKRLLQNVKIESITFDNGVEFSQHEQIGCQTYFCHPYSSWEKGAVEYANKLLRRFFPKKTKLSNISQEQLQLALWKINNTPRKCLNYKTPIETYLELTKQPP